MSTRVLPLVALFVALGIFFLYVSPTWSGSIGATKAAIAADDQALAAANQFAAQQNTLASARDAIDPADLTRLTAFLPNSVDNVGLILDLNALAARSGFSLSSIDVISKTTSVANAPAAGQQGLPAAGASPLGFVDMSLSAVGTYAALQSFLSGVERSARLLDVRDIVVKGSDTGVYNYQMLLRLYWLR
ncbi:MAG: type II secretion system protein M [Candidatus Parcubacteria bacterium]|nr:type II secretion system protein M [Candidatus Parcubacteria bacterium]